MDFKIGLKLVLASSLALVSLVAQALQDAQTLHPEGNGPYNGTDGPLALSDIISSRKVPDTIYPSMRNLFEIEMCWVVRDNSGIAYGTRCGIPQNRWCGAGGLISMEKKSQCWPTYGEVCLVNATLTGVNPFAWTAQSNGSCVKFELGKSYSATKIYQVDVAKYLSSRPHIPKPGTAITWAGTSCVVGQSCDLILDGSGQVSEINLRVDTDLPSGTALTLYSKPCVHQVTCQRMLGQPAAVYPIGVYSPVVFAKLAETAAAQATTAPALWTKLPGSAKDIGAGANGAVWVISAKDAGAGGFGIYRLDGANWTQMPGAAERISVDGQGNPWVVSRTGEIYRWSGSSWSRLPGAGKEIAVNAAGQAWMLGTKAIGGGYEVYRWNGSDWALMPGGMTRLAVDSKGNPWGINATNQILRWNGSAWQQMPGSAFDIAIGGDDTVFVAGVNEIYKWDGAAWQRRDATGVASIAVDGKGVPYVVTVNGEIYRGTH